MTKITSDEGYRLTAPDVVAADGASAYRDAGPDTLSAAPSVPVTIIPRRPLDDEHIDGYKESDVDYVLNNIDAAVLLLDAQLEDRAPPMFYYELHITLLGNAALIERRVEAIKWKYSRIDGDPVEGAGVKCYATLHLRSTLSENAVLDILNTAADRLGDQLVTITRRKIEKVIYDDRSSKVRFNDEVKPY